MFIIVNYKKIAICVPDQSRLRVKALIGNGSMNSNSPTPDKH